MSNNLQSKKTLEITEAHSIISMIVEKLEKCSVNKSAEEIIDYL